MKLINKVTILLTVIAVVGILMYQSNSNTSKKPNISQYSNNTTAIFLRVNQYYILFSNPSAPFIETNYMKVPLVSLSKLIGFKITTQRPESLIISFNNHNLHLVVNSKTAILDDKTINLNTPVVIKKDAIYAPIKVVLEAFNIPASWDHYNKLLQIKDKRLMKTQIIKDIEDTLPSFARNNISNKFVPISYRLFLKTENNNTVGTIDLFLKNITGKEIPAGKEDVYTAYIFNTQTILTPAIGSSDIPARTREVVKTHGVRKRTDKLFAPNNGKLLYILSW